MAEEHLAWLSLDGGGVYLSDPDYVVPWETFVDESVADMDPDVGRVWAQNLREFADILEGKA